MLEIIVNNRVSLDLLPDIEINFLEENPLFLTDRIPSPYSLSFEVPLTSKNQKAFGFPSRTTSKSSIWVQPAEIRHSGLVLSRGELLILNVNNTIKLQFKGSREPQEVGHNLNNLNLGSRNYGSFPYSAENIFYNSPGLQNYVQSMKEIAVSGSGYVIAPIKFEGTTWTGSEYANGITNSVRQYVNYFNPVYQNFCIYDENKVHSPILPFIYVYKIIDAVFGKSLANNLFREGDLEKLVLISSNHPNYIFDNLYGSYWTVINYQNVLREAIFPLVDNYTPATGLVPLEWKFQSFCQAYCFRDLLKSLLSIFSMTLFPGIQFKMEYNNDILGRKQRHDWNLKLAGKLDITNEVAKDYYFNYKNVTHSDTVVNTSFSTINEMFNWAIDTALEEGSLYRDKTTGAQYKISRKLRGLTSDPWLTCEIDHSPLAVPELEGKREKFEVSSDVRPADLVIEQYWWQDKGEKDDLVRKRHWFVPKIEKQKIDQAPYLMFFAGMANTFQDAGQYPILLAHHTDQFGVKRLNTSLHPTGPDGLIEKFHYGMKQWYEKDKIKAKGSFLLSPLEIKKLDIRDKIYLQGKLFFIEKMEYTLTNNGISLVDVDLIEY